MNHGVGTTTRKLRTWRGRRRGGWRVRLAVLLVVGQVLALAGARPAAAAPVTILPDLESLIPTGDMSIDHSQPGHREFRYTHLVANTGQGALEIRPEYDPTTDNARGYQRIFERNGGTTSLKAEIPMGGLFLYHAVHGHYHYPLASFGLFNLKPDGTIGTPAAMSPKVGFCIADSEQITPGVGGESQHSPANCTDPRANIGITPQWTDVYDHRDDGQSVPIEGLPDGTYWFRSIVDPDNFLVEADENNNITDVKVQITGDNVTVLESHERDIAPPAVSLTTPANGSTLAGNVTFQATASHTSGITGVEFLLDGVPLGPIQTTAPFQFTWDSTSTANGPHVVTARAYTGDGLRGAAPAALVSVSNTAAGAGLAIDVSTSKDGTGAQTTAPITTATAGETLLAFVSSDGPSGSAQTSTVAGGGLTWQLVKRANAQPGTGEVWKATAPAALSSATFTSTPGLGGFSQSFTVVAFQNAGGIGVTAGGSALTGAPSASITTTRDGSWVFGAGNDWDRAVARVLPGDQTFVHQYLDTSVGDTLWSQSTLAPTPSAGTVVNLRALSPTNDRWNFAAVELLPTGVATPGPIISNVLAGNRTSSSATITWTTDVPSTSSVELGPTLAYGQQTPVDSTLTTSHSVLLSGLSSETQYHYRVTSTDAANVSRRSVDFVFSTAAVSTLFCDLTAPLVGATVSGTVAVKATASSTASVTGVQFKLDGNNLNAEDLTAPYSTSWNTTTVPDGVHTLTAVVRDPTGNSKTSAPVSVTVANNPTSPLVAAYSFNAGSGPTAADTSGLGNDGTLAGPTWNTTGKFGGSLTFNGTDARVVVPDAPSLRLTTGMTLEAWVRPAKPVTGVRSVVAREASGALGYGLYGNSSTDRAAGLANVGGGNVFAPGAAKLGANKWTYLAVTFDGTTLKLYQGGALKSSVVVPGSLLSGAGALQIGGTALFGEYFAGQIDEVRVFNKARTIQQIRADMKAPIT